MTFSPLLTLEKKKKATKKQVSEMNEKRKWFSSPPEGMLLERTALFATNLLVICAQRMSHLQ